MERDLWRVLEKPTSLARDLHYHSIRNNMSGGVPRPSIPSNRTSPKPITRAGGPRHRPLLFVVCASNRVLTTYGGLLRGSARNRAAERSRSRCSAWFGLCPLSIPDLRATLWAAQVVIAAAVVEQVQR